MISNLSTSKLKITNHTRKFKWKCQFEWFINVYYIVTNLCKRTTFKWIKTKWQKIKSGNLISFRIFKYAFPFSFIGLLDNFTFLMSFDKLAAKLFIIIVKSEAFFFQSFNCTAAESFSFWHRSSILRLKVLYVNRRLNRRAHWNIFFWWLNFIIQSIRTYSNQKINI